MEETNQNKRVVVAMSGGVDSSVAAFILKEQGYEVVGISLKLWDYDEPERAPSSKTCCSFRDIKDAGSVCADLGIPFYAFNYKEHFENSVIKPFVSEYKKGRTPNPCVLCNQHVKFDRLLVEAQKLGADYLASGHYAQIVRDADGTCHLRKGKDPSKDQSYVLYGLTQQELKKVLLPIGAYTKQEIREMARKVNLPTADKHESQDICFVPNNDYAKFIEKYDPSVKHEPGNFVDSTGKILGKHEGIHAYTVGQRRGLKVAMGERYYVLRIDSVKNEIVLGEKADTFKMGFLADGLSWVLPEEKVKPFLKDCSVKIRYQKNELPAYVEVLDGMAQVNFVESHPGVTPGQAAVFYHGEEVLGGGWIKEVINYRG